MNQVSGSDIKSQIAKIQSDAENGVPTAITGHGKVKAVVMPSEWAAMYDVETQSRFTILRARYNVDSDVEVIQRLLREDTLREILSEIKAIKGALSVLPHAQGHG